jgi:hypothetical protein
VTYVSYIVDLLSLVSFLHSQEDQAVLKSDKTESIRSEVSQRMDFGPVLCLLVPNIAI